MYDDLVFRPAGYQPETWRDLPSGQPAEMMKLSGLLGQHSVNNKPMLKNKDGSVSTEETITIGVDGRFYNIPTIVNGVRVPPHAAELMFRAGQNKAVGEFNSLEEAVREAEKRSKMLGNSIPSGLLGR